MNEACVQIVRMAVVLDLLPWGSASRGKGKSELARELGQRGIDVHADSLLRNLKEWQPLLQLVCTRDENGKTYWKRASRNHGFSHLLDLEEFLGEALETSLDDGGSGMSEYRVPEWPSDIYFSR